MFCLFFCSEVTVSFTLFFHYRLAYLFTFYCHLGIHLQTEWSPVFLEAHFLGSATGNVLSRTRKGSSSGAVPRPQLSPLDSVYQAPPSLASLGGYFPFSSLASPSQKLSFFGSSYTKLAKKGCLHNKTKDSFT